MGRNRKINLLVILVVVGLGSAERLPRLAIPEKYELSIVTRVDQGIRQYGGNVKIQFLLEKESFTLTLHSKELVIDHATVWDDSGSEISVLDTAIEAEKDFVHFLLNGTLQKDSQYTIEIEFHGELKTGTAGFYLSKYFKVGETQPTFLAATQFEPTRARSAFPCFDEPEYKSTFELTITHGSTYRAISNTPAATTSNGDGTSTTHFEATPVMSVYLLAFVVSDLVSYLDFKNQRIFSRPGMELENILPAWTFSTNFLDVMEKRFNFTYEIGKLDSVAVPDHGSAMENWGLILYKEQYLLLEKAPHPYEMYDVIGTVAHELAHQFFGNVVTCKWWNQIWLNEGIATWLEFVLPEAVDESKSVRFFDLFNIRKTQNAFRYDSLQTTRPMTNDVDKVITAAQISSQFDTIAYDKSGAVFRMFQYTVTDELFTNALHKYLVDNKNKPVTSDDLMDAFESFGITNFDFSRAFRTWELQKGYPLLTVHFNATKSAFQLTQKRYLSITETEEPGSSSSWYIPLSFTTSPSPNFDDNHFTHFFPDGEGEFEIPQPSLDPSDWFVFNIQQLGYYRVNYDDSNWRRLIEVLNSDQYHTIHVLNRAQLVDDALTLAFDGVLSYDIALGVVSYLSRETDFIPWYPAVIAFDKLDYILRGTEDYGSFQRFLRLLVRNLYTLHDFGSVNSLVNSEQSAMELAVDLMCRAGNRQCLENSHREMMKSLPKPLEIVYICNGLKGENRSGEFWEHFERFEGSFYQTERLRIINGLLCSSEEENLWKLLETTISNETFYRSHEKRRIYTKIAEKSSVGLETLIDFILEKHEDVVREFPEENFIDSLLTSASKRIATPTEEEIILNGFAQLQSKSLVQDETLETITKNINFNKDWAESQSSSEISIFIHNFFKKFENQLRLPKIAVPTKYSLHLDVSKVHTGALPYTGQVSIDCDIIEATDRILLHSKDQIIENLKVYHQQSNEEVEVLDFSLNPDTDTLAIYFFEFLTVNSKIRIEISYSTQLLTRIDGLYRDSYTEFDENQRAVTKYLATTQFQAVEARRCFPSFDEPEFRAVFEVRISHHVTYNAVSNMPATIQTLSDENTTTTHFQATPPMSTYLLAFLVSDFKYLSNENQPDQTLQRIYTRPGIEQKAKYGLDNSVRLLEALEDFVNIEFDLPKLDSGAIPGKGGGMENWGLVLYREAALVYEENDADISHSVRQRGVRLIAHEIAHMFFGNLVTCEWWNYLWLNEGFATYIMYYLSDKIYPEWRMHEFYSRNIMLPYAFVTDASESTRAMSAELTTVDEINDSFDDITYDKASCVLRMFHHAVGDEVFRNALHLYLDTNKYKSVTSQHLINAMQTKMTEHGVSDFPFERAFRSWENQAGFPLVSVHYNPTTHSFHLTQQRFFDDRARNEGDSSSWYIPINYATATNSNFSDTHFTHYFEDGEDSLVIFDDNHSENDWYVFNKQQIGYYRVNYDDSNWIAIRNVLKSHTDFEKINILNRVQIIDDLFSLAHAGYASYEHAYEILLYLQHESDFFAWDAAMLHLEELYDVFGPQNEQLNMFILKLSEYFYNSHNILDVAELASDTMPKRYSRELAINIACRAGNEECKQMTNNYGFLHLSGISSIPRGLEQPILCNFFKQNSDPDAFRGVFDRMIKMYQPMESAHKAALINSLACTKDPDFLYELLETSLGSATNNVNFTLSDRRLVFNAVIANENGMDAAFRLIENYQSSEVTSSYSWSWERVLTSIATSVFTESDLYRFLEKISTLSHPLIEATEKNAAIEAANGNLNGQKMTKNVNQMEFIAGLLEREFDVTTTTITPPTTTTTTTTTTTMEPTTTTEAKASILTASILIFITTFIIIFEF